MVNAFGLGNHGEVNVVKVNPRLCVVQSVMRAASVNCISGGQGLMPGRLRGISLLGPIFRA